MMTLGWGGNGEPAEDSKQKIGSATVASLGGEREKQRKATNIKAKEKQELAKKNQRNNLGKTMDIKGKRLQNAPPGREQTPICLALDRPRNCLGSAVRWPPIHPPRTSLWL